MGVGMRRPRREEAGRRVAFRETAKVAERSQTTLSKPLVAMSLQPRGRSRSAAPDWPCCTWKGGVLELLAAEGAPETSWLL